MCKKQHIAIYTTACLPWMTGTAVNPLFRAAYLAKDEDRDVTLVIPWLSPKDQTLVYPNNISFSSPPEHEHYIRLWLEERIDFPLRFSIKFYPGKFARDKGSIFPVGDITAIIPDEQADIAVLEEPEHLTWYHHGKKWKAKFHRVIGVIHTNYLEYVKREKNGYMIAFFLMHANSWVTHIYCHKIIRLSGATQDLPRSIICNVHGVNPKFLKIGRVKQEQQQQRSGHEAFTKGAYYIGKMVWNKGYKELLKLLKVHEDELSGLQVDLYGNGEDSDEVKQAASKFKMTVRVFPGRDHTDPLFHDYKVFLNPSTTDVVCTTTAEALAMGKIVICANHPSNYFFKQFTNCRTYDTSDEFMKLTLQALEEEPVPLTKEQWHVLSWEAATERFIVAAELDQAVPLKTSSVQSKSSVSSYFKPRKLKRGLEEASAYAHQGVSGIEIARRAFGAIPKTLKPDEQLRKELSIPKPDKKHSFRLKLLSQK